MKTLKEPNKKYVGVLLTQRIESGLEYVESPYIVKNDNLFFNTLTAEAVLVEDEKKDRPELIRRWFYIPKGMDPSTLAHLIRQKDLLIYSGPGSNKKSLYTIFTTTACNASCSYCFEKGYDIYTMDLETADKVSDYIIETRDKRGPIQIKWFGGEPLVNNNVINRISKNLIDSKVDYTSGIISNGNLLDGCSDEELKDIWKVRTIQLTFDDINDEYSKIKGLDRDAYPRLLKNIERLEELGIRVNARIHYNELLGIEPCLRIVEDLKVFKNVSMYTRIVYGKETIQNYSNILKIEEAINRYGKNRFSLPVYGNPTHCMADNSRMATITPTGEFTPCEHYAYGEHMYGSIYSRERKQDVLNRWSVREKYQSPDCKTCPLYPSCRKLVMCPAEGKCSDGYQYYQIETIKRALRKKVEEINGRDSNTNN